MWCAAKNTCLFSMAGGVQGPMTRQFTRTPPGAAVVMPVLSTATAEGTSFSRRGCLL